MADLSLADFEPKRFALNYNPPMIVLEYLVPSTGKLYHHKMKLRHLTGKSTVPECIKYLEKIFKNMSKNDFVASVLGKK